MANNSNTDSRLVWVKAMERGQCFPLDATEIWYSLEDAQTYAQEDPTAYVGQTIKVIDEDNETVVLYTIGLDGSLINNMIINANDVQTREDGTRLDTELQLLSDQISSYGMDTTKTFEDLTILVTNHIDATNNPHAVTKEQVGLGNVDNTADIDKPVSIATQEAINMHAFDTDNPHMTNKVHVGLGNVNNTSDLNKPISKATQQAIDDLNDIDYSLISFDTSWIVPKNAESNSIVGTAKVGNARVGYI